MALFRRELFSEDESSEAFKRRFTGLDHREADALRTHINKHNKGHKTKKLILPPSSAEKVRMYFELVLKQPVPPDVMAATARGATDPAADVAAVELAEQMTVDLRMVSGTGPNGMVTKDDVLKKMASNVDDMPPDVRAAMLAEYMKTATPSKPAAKKKAASKKKADPKSATEPVTTPPANEDDDVFKDG